MTATLPSNSSTAPTRSHPDLDTIDPTAPAAPVNVAEYGFEGRFEDWTADTRWYEYTRAADPVGLGYTPAVPAETQALAERLKSVKAVEEMIVFDVAMSDAVKASVDKSWS